MEIAQRRACPVCGGRGRIMAAFESLGLERCLDCGLVFLGDADTEGIAARYESGEYAESHAMYLEEASWLVHQARQRVRWLTRRVSVGRLLELGPGSGHFLAAASHAGFEPTGVEPSPVFAQRVEDEFGVPVLRGFVEDVDLTPGSFDLVCMFHVLEHVEHPVTTLEALRGLLAPAGLLAVEVPNISSAMADRRGETWSGVEPQKLHISHFSPTTLRQVLERSGFELCELETVSPWQFIPPSRRLGARQVMGFAYRAARLRTLRQTHPTGFDNLRLIATPRGG